MLKNNTNEFKTLEQYEEYFLPHLGKVYSIKTGNTLRIKCIKALERVRTSVIGDNGQYDTNAVEVSVTSILINAEKSSIEVSNYNFSVDAKKLKLWDNFFLFEESLIELSKSDIEAVEELKLNVLNEIETLYDKICK